MGSEMHTTLDRPAPSALYRTIGLAFAATLLFAAAVGAQQTSSTTAGSGEALLDGRTLTGWTHVGPGRFIAEQDGSIVGEGGPGLLYYGSRAFKDFALDVDYMTESTGANSGVVVRIPAPPKSADDASKAGYAVGIDNLADAIRTTGAISDVAAPSRMAGKPGGQWNHYRIEGTGQRYPVFLHGEVGNDLLREPARVG